MPFNRDLQTTEGGAGLEPITALQLPGQEAAWRSGRRGAGRGAGVLYSLSKGRASERWVSGGEMELWS